MLKKFTTILLMAILFFNSLQLNAATQHSIPSILGIRFEFVFFALILICIAFFSKKSMQVALIGLSAIILFKILFVPEFSFIHHFLGTATNKGEWNSLLNLTGLLFGFSILTKHFQDSKLPELLPDYLPNDWKGGFILLVLIMAISSFLDNIAAAMIGGSIAMVVYKGKVHIGYLAAIIAASNAGGAGSVVGDTTTTLMWIDGVAPLQVFHAFIGSIVAILIFGIIASIQQDRYQRIQKDSTVGVKIDWGKLLIVFFILIGAIVTNWIFNFPALGVWIAILIGAIFHKTHWDGLKMALPGTIFLLSLVTCASLMPVEQLPIPSWHSSFILGFISAVFDNIPLTKLCLVQGGYDWGILAFAVGFGGSMIWFGSSAGVALSNIYPEIRSVENYVSKGWHVIVAYIFGFFILLLATGWEPNFQKQNNNNEYRPINEKIQLIK